MREEIDIGDGTDERDGFNERLQSLDDRRQELGDGRGDLDARRLGLVPVETYVAAQHEEFDSRRRTYDAEEKAIARDAAELRRDIAAARKEAARAQKQQLKELAEEHKGQLGDLDNVAEDLADFQKVGDKSA